MKKKYIKNSFAYTFIFCGLFFSVLSIHSAFAQRPNFLADPGLGVSRERAESAQENQDEYDEPSQVRKTYSQTQGSRVQMTEREDEFPETPSSSRDDELEPTAPQQLPQKSKKAFRRGTTSQLPSPSETTSSARINTTIPAPEEKTIKITNGQPSQTNPQTNNQEINSTSIGNTTEASSKEIPNTKLIYVPATNVISDLGDILSQIKSRVTMPVIFPPRIPVPELTTKYFITSSASSNQQQYTIFIDTTPRCDGAQFCNIGTINAYNNGFPFIYYSLDNKDITVPVMLTHGIKGFYTPAHPMADMWPTQLEWRDKNILYTITWRHLPTADEKQMIISIANSAINMGYR